MLAVRGVPDGTGCIHSVVDSQFRGRVLHEIEEKAPDFSRGMNPTTHDTNYPH